MQLQFHACNRVLLPRGGDDLANAVGVLVKTVGVDESDKLAAGIMHHVRVRRCAVVALISETKRRGHRAHDDVDMRDVDILRYSHRTMTFFLNIFVLSC